MVQIVGKKHVPCSGSSSGAQRIFGSIMRTALCLLLAQSVLGYLRKGVEEEHNNPPPHRLLQEAKIVADRGRFGEQNFPLGLCEGDCDNDRDCQPGLVCLDRQSKTDSLGGCSGRINSRADICVPESGLTPVASPVRAPTPRPPVEPPVSPPVRAPRDVGVDTGDVFALKLYWQLGKSVLTLQITFSHL